jgi:PAS domain S-box-containing protein
MRLGLNREIWSRTQWRSSRLWSKLRLPQDRGMVRTALGLALALLCMVGLSSYDNVYQLVQHYHEVQHTYQMLHGIDQVNIGIKDVVLGRRGYVISESEDFLQMFRSGLQSTEMALDRLQQLATESPEQRRRLQSLRPLIQQRFSSLRQSIGIQRNFPEDLEAQSALTQADVKIEQRIQSLLGEMVDAENLLLNQRSQNADISLQKTRLTNVLGYGLSFGLLIGAFYLFEQEIQQRQAAEQAARQAVYEVEDLYNQAPCGYHSLDADGCYVRINNTELEWLGYRRHEVMGRPITDFLTPESIQLFETHFAEFVARGRINNQEIQFVRRDGSVMPVSLNATALRDANGQFIMSRSTLFDLRELKQVEAALRTSETLFRLLCDFAPIGIFMTNVHGQTIYTNAQAQTSCGYSLAESLGYGWTQFIHPDDLPWLWNRWQGDLANQRGSTYSDVRCLQQDGSVNYICVRTVPIFDEFGALVSFVGTIEDVTESRAIAQMKTEFVSIVSHELRTPLTAIRGSLGLLAAGVFDHKPEKGKRMVQVAAEQTDRLVRLINDLLDFQRLESGKLELRMQTCDAAALLHQSIEALRPSAEQHQVALTVQSAPVQVWANPDAIVQTLTNLLSNAIKFSTAGQTVQVSLTKISALPQGCPNPYPLPDQVVGYALFEVSDQGRGIPVNMLERIFEQFQQVDASDSRQKGGTGLGLAICRKLIEQHQGQIWAESGLEQGSRFYFTLPLRAAAFNLPNLKSQAKSV